MCSRRSPNDRRRGTNSFYHNNAMWPWKIDATGEVSNANA